MQDLRLIAVENGAILVVTEDGAEFRLPLDDALRAKLAQAGAGVGAGTAPRMPLTSRLTQGRVAPREIQAHIRSGMSAEDVAAITGAPLDYIEKFERPVLAEREHIIESALNVAVHTAADPDPLGAESTFGSAIRGRLRGLGATDERWASWKESASDWVVKLSFTVGQIEHDARWNYDPRRSSLAPLNSEASTLSQQGAMPGSLTPKLRAVGGDERMPDSSRFDSGAFDVRSSSRGTSTQPPASSFSRAAETSPGVAAAAIKRAPIDPTASSQTADLLDALRRRRGERESAASWSEDDRSEASSGIRAVDVPLDDLDEVERELSGTASDDRPAAPPQTAAPRPSAFPLSQPAASPRSSKKGRAAMPSWDEIVFGTRSDEDPA